MCSAPSTFCLFFLKQIIQKWPSIPFLVVWFGDLDPEMEFLDINLTKGSNLLLHGIHIPFYWRILKKIILYSIINNLYKKKRETRNSSLLMNNIR
jgi:hypothetical protein